jgi:hypothetical protein
MVLIWIQQDNDTEYNALNPQPRWHGTCIHDFKIPRWVQKRRHVEPSEAGLDDVGGYENPKRATKVAINSKFSLIAIGTQG